MAEPEDRLLRLVIGVDNVDALRDSAVGRAGFAELEALVPVCRRVALLHHRHENIGLGENAADFRPGAGIGGCRIVAAQGLFLRTDDILCGADVIARAPAERGRSTWRQAGRKRASRRSCLRGVIWLSQPIESYACPARSANLVGSIGHYRRQTNETTSTGLLRASAAWLQMAVTRFDFFCA
jgi:hypothetical protein